MFVFKAAVVGAGTMGGQIAQTIAAAGIPVVLKDIDDALVQAGLDEAAQRDHAGRSANSSRRARSPPSRPRRRSRRSLGRIDGTTSYEGFGDVDFVVEAVPERMEIKQAVFAELDAATPGHAILASNTSSLSITEIGEATLRPDKVVGFHYFYPASIMPLIEIVEGEETSAETVTRGRHVRPGDPQAADHLRRGSRLRRQPHPQLGHLRGLARAGGEGPVDQEDRRGRGRRRRRARWAPTSSSTCSASTPSCTSPSTCVESYGEERFYVPKGMQKLVADGKLGAKTGGDGFYDPQGEPNIPGEGEPDVDGAGRAAVAEDVPRGLPGARGGRGHPPRHRLRDDGRRRPGPAPGADAAVHEGRQRRPRHGPRAHGERRRSATASASRRRRSCAAWSPRGGSGRRPGRASTPTRSPTPSSRPR